jgi:hypothetical protein
MTIMERQFVAAAMLALAGCGGPSGPIQPGMWETTMTMAAGNSELWSSTIGRCIYDEEAANPGSGFFKGGQLRDCQTTQSSFSGGEFSVEATCPERQSVQANVPMTPDWLASKVAIKGKYTSTAISGTLSAELLDTLEPMHFTGTLNARRTGDC